MKAKSSFVLFLLFLFISVESSGQTEIPKADTKRFEEARFGMFVHFGAYSVFGAGEWVMNTRPVSGKDYKHLQDFFNPHTKPLS
jgi:alpha-L-fucosidase